ncbi:rod shape-determining protein MreD [Patescibacteria group bacterium]|nr:rod shape-determining protein MreD [Patescibacteria group bacterium]
MLLTLLTILIVLIDITWGPLFVIRGIAPDVLLVWVAAVAILRPCKVLRLAFVAGLLKDFLVGCFLGTHAGALLVMAGLVLVFKDRLFQNKLMTRVVLLGILSLSYPVVVSWSRGGLSVGRVLYNLVVFPLIFMLVSKVSSGNEILIKAD